MERPSGPLLETAGRHRYCQIGREVGTTVDPPRTGEHHLNEIGRIAVRCAKPAGIPFHQNQIGTWLIKITI